MSAREVAYDYVDERGELLFQVVRKPGKSFRQRRPDGNGGRLYNLDGCRRVIYRLPAVIEAVKSGRRVWIVEGEKDVHALEEAGEVATCNPGGAGKWREEYAEALRGATVFVVADNDQAGVKHATQVMWSLAEAGAADVRLFRAATGNDVSDHLAAGKSLADLVELDWRAAGDQLLVDMTAAMAAAAEPLPYVVEGFACRGYVTVLAGQHSSRKTWLALLLGAAVHGGRTALAGFAIAPTTVLYVDAENGPRLLGRRFREAGIPADGLLVADGSALRLPGDLDRLAMLVERTGAGLVVLDSLRRLAPGMRENESDSTAPLMHELACLAREQSVALVVIHHRSVKPGAADSRGSSAIEDQADVVFRLDRHGDRSKLRPVKFRIDAEPEPRWLSFALDVDTGTLGLDATGPPEGAKEEPSAESGLAQAIRSLAPQTPREEGWTPSRLAAAVGSNRESGTFKRAVRALLDSGEWEAEGEGKARRLRPRQPGQPGQPLGNGPVGPVQEGADDGQERLSFEDAFGDAEFERLRRERRAS